VGVVLDCYLLISINIFSNIVEWVAEVQPHTIVRSQSCVYCFFHNWNKQL